MNDDKIDRILKAIEALINAKLLEGNFETRQSDGSGCWYTSYAERDELRTVLMDVFKDVP